MLKVYCTYIFGSLCLDAGRSVSRCGCSRLRGSIMGAAMIVLVGDGRVGLRLHSASWDCASRRCVFVNKYAHVVRVGCRLLAAGPRALYPFFGCTCAGAGAQAATLLNETYWLGCHWRA